MREALARTDHDFYLAEDADEAPRAGRAADRAAGRASGRSRAVSVAAPARKLPRPSLPTVHVPAFVRRFARQPMRSLVGFTFSGLMIGIVVNALVLQHGPHPAPLFGRGQVPPAPPVTAIPVPPPRPAALDAPAAEQATTQATGNVATTSTAPLPPTVRPAPAHEADPLGALIRSGGTNTTGSIPIAEERVAALQRALVKIGLAPRDTKIDGLMGGTTRQAIERFEKKMNWPVTGEPSAKLARVLAAQSGIPVPDAPAR